MEQPRNSTSPPSQGYLGTNIPRSGRQVRLPEWVFNLVSTGDILHFSYHPQKFFPVFSPSRSQLKGKGADSGYWPAVDNNTVRKDDDVPVVQLPSRYFSDFTSPTKTIELDPVPEAAQIAEDKKLHFVVGWPPHGDSFICFLLTTQELAETDESLLSQLFATAAQRSRIIDNLDEEDMFDGEIFVVQLFDRLTKAIQNDWEDGSIP